MSGHGVADGDMNRSGVQKLWQALIAGDRESAANAYANDAVMHFPQAGTFIAGRDDIAYRGLLQLGEAVIGLNRMVGEGQVWVSECETYTHGQEMLLVSVAEMHNGLILREARYRMPTSAGRCNGTRKTMLRKSPAST